MPPYNPAAAANPAGGYDDDDDDGGEGGYDGGWGDMGDMLEGGDGDQLEVVQVCVCGRGVTVPWWLRLPWCIASRRPAALRRPRCSLVPMQPRILGP